MTYFNYTRYPEVTNFVKYHLPKLNKTKPKVFEAFRGLIDWPEEKALKVLTYQKRPKIIIKPLINRYGYTPGDYNHIELNSKLVLDCEKFLGKSSSGEGFILLPNYHIIKDQILLLLEATILHELVHWCRAKPVHSTPQYKIEERAAQNFERKAYGKKYTVHNLGICQYIRDPSNPNALSPKLSIKALNLRKTHNFQSEHEQEESALMPRTGKYHRIFIEDQY